MEWIWFSIGSIESVLKMKRDSYAAVIKVEIVGR
jgi:hypothetical protein